MQDSFGNPIPDPKADAAPEKDAPVVATPTETVAEPAPVADEAPVETPAETTANPAPAFDAPADPAPVADTPVTDPAPASVIAPAGGEKKSNHGLIIGIIIAVLVIGIAAVLQTVLPFSSRAVSVKGYVWML